MTSILRFVANALCVLSVAMSVGAQTPEQRKSCERDFAPSSGQPGKDVIWVPTPDALVTSMLKAANVTSKDIVYDLGAGDGKIAIAAARDFGARSVGIEYEPKMAKLASCLATAAGLGDRVRIIQGDIFETDFSEATVVTLYLLPSLNERLMPTILKMRPGTRVVSHSFLMGDWQPDQEIKFDGYDRAFYWVVPAQVAGNWTFRAPDRPPLTAKLTQRYQTIQGVVVDEGREIPIQSASIRGNELELSYVGPNGTRTLKATISPDRTVANVSDSRQSTTQYVGSLD